MKRWRSLVRGALCLALVNAARELRAQAATAPAIAPSELPAARAIFVRMHALVARDMAGGVATHLTPEQTARFSTLAAQIRSILEHAEDKSAVRGTLSAVGYRLNEYWQGVNAAYGSSSAIPPAVLTEWNALSGKILTAIVSDLGDAERKFFVKYGGSSERLNIVEIYLNERLFTRAPMGELARGPRRGEPIVRMTTLGYQWYADSSRARPSSPIYEVGMTWYIFGGLLAPLNHIGVAAAYEHDLVLGTNIGGFALHLGRFEIVGMCDALRGCANHVLALSKNVQLIPWPSLLRR
jgi:hypothetical protein